MFSPIHLVLLIFLPYSYKWEPGWLSRYSDSLRAGRSGDQTPVAARFSAPVQTGPGAHAASYTTGIGFFPGVKQPERRVDNQPHLEPLWALMTCSRLNFTFTFTFTSSYEWLHNTHNCCLFYNYKRHWSFILLTVVAWSRCDDNVYFSRINE
jgi:hypothetical protein